MRPKPGSGTITVVENAVADRILPSLLGIVAPLAGIGWLLSRGV